MRRILLSCIILTSIVLDELLLLSLSSPAFINSSSLVVIETFTGDEPDEKIDYILNSREPELKMMR